MQINVLPLFNKEPLVVDQHLPKGRHFIDEPILTLIEDSLSKRPFLYVTYDTERICPDCGEVLSNVEFKTLAYSWPLALLHYIQWHDYKLPKAFRKFLIKNYGQITMPFDMKG